MEHEHGDHDVAQAATSVLHLPYPAGGDEDFTRADVVVTGVDHSRCSYEVRMFLNNPDATSQSARDETSGYAGRFHVFGHGGCFGDLGHCDVPPPATDPTDLRRPHPLTPLSTYVTITAALRRLLDAAGSLETLTLVPVSLPPDPEKSRPAPDLFRYDHVDLRTYLTPLDVPVP